MTGSAVWVVASFYPHGGRKARLQVVAEIFLLSVFALTVRIEKSRRQQGRRSSGGDGCLPILFSYKGERRVHTKQRRTEKWKTV